jgi:hypothetical protein
MRKGNILTGKRVAFSQTGGVAIPIDMPLNLNNYAAI